MSRIYGERIVLREYQDSDVDYIKQWVNDPESQGLYQIIFCILIRDMRRNPFSEQWLKASLQIKVLLSG